MRTKLTLLTSLLLLACAAVFAQGGKPDFSGTWSLDKEKSDMGGGPGGGQRMVSPSMIIEHKDPQLTIKRKFEFQGEERTQELKYTTDGQPNTNEGFRGRTIKSKTYWEGNKLIIEATRETRQGTMETKEVFSPSEDGKTLTVNAGRKDAPGPGRKLVYVKQ